MEERGNSGKTELEIGVVRSECGKRVSERDTVMKMMQEWKFGARRKACVCIGIWLKWIGKRPAVKGAVRTLQALRSDG
jgi:hypothetical protein